MPTKMKQFSSHTKAASEQVQLWPGSTHLPGESVTSHRRLLIRRGRLGGPLTNGLGYNWGRASAASSGGHRPNELPLTNVLHNCEREKPPKLLSRWLNPKQHSRNVKKTANSCILVHVQLLPTGVTVSAIHPKHMCAALCNSYTTLCKFEVTSGLLGWVCLR